MKCERASEGRGSLYEALEHLQAAMDLLDLSGAPGQIAAHVDLAVHQLREVIDRNVGEGVEVKST